MSPAEMPDTLAQFEARLGAREAPRVPYKEMLGTITLGNKKRRLNL